MKCQKGDRTEMPCANVGFAVVKSPLGGEKNILSFLFATRIMRGSFSFELPAIADGIRTKFMASNCTPI